jgi:uracil-DNA glycosylase family 4
MSTSKTETKVARKHPAALCEECPLYNRAVASSQIPTGRAKAAIVSRSPGYHDAAAGRPFSGPSGDVLNYLLAQNGIKREEVLVTNVVLCSPPEGKVPPAAIKACAPRLTEELANVGNATIIAAGAEAVTSLIGPGSIDSRRGYAIERNGKRIIATNNPALVLRDDSTFPNLVKDFARAFNPKPAPTMPKVVLIEGVEDAKKALQAIQNKGTTFAADIESRGGLTHRATLVSLQFAYEASSSIVFGERSGLFTNTDFIDNHLRPFFEDTSNSFIWHNGIFDTKVLRHTYGIRARVDEDTLLLSWATDERGGTESEGSLHSLEYLMMEEFAWPYYTPASVASFKKTGELVPLTTQKKLEKEHGPDYKESDEYKKIEAQNYIALYKYAGYDAAGTYQLFDLLKSRAVSDNVFDRPYRETLLAAEDVLRSMETTGMPYDYNRAAEMLEKQVDPEMAAIVADIAKLTDKPLINPGSSQQMAAVYYDDFQVFHAMQDRPDKKRSVDESSRKEMIDGRFTFNGEHTAEMIDGKMVKKPAQDAQKTRNLITQIAKQHDRYKKLEKQAGTYLHGLIKEAEVDPESRIYTSLPRHATSTGRLASRGPNLQNVTRTKEGLPDIRGLFFALPGTLLVQADYSQAELRTIAALSGDRLLMGVYERGEDLHNLTAERFYGKDYTKENRANSKNMNFGVFYRQSAETFQEKHEIPTEEAQKYIDWVWSTFTGVKEWEQSIEQLVHKQKHRNYTYVESPFGHRRRFYLITKENRKAVYREAINFLPQNIAANLTLHACIKLHNEVDPKRAKLCLTVHDSILAQVRDDYVDDYQSICKQVMATRPHELLQWLLPFKADVGAGKTWATA